jgi:2-polyprenyl-3-methyl-5-hydroxy-6-metoxy-1,4-benzoquinol methylase
VVSFTKGAGDVERPGARIQAEAAGDSRWPSDGLETVKACPVCGSETRELLYSGLTDRVFFCAPGTWTLYRCLPCRAAYLDPRPTPDSIRLAYRNYFTHEPPPLAPVRPQTRLGRIKATLRNDYLRSRYGINLGASMPMGRLAVYLAIRRRPNLDRAVRHLKSPAPGARLLDVGCGNGGFLITAQQLGWEAWGIEPDRDAVTAARAAGLRVEHGGLPTTDLPDAHFDVVTMNHVLEHLHDPVSALREVRRVLKPGGMLWLATPNLDSIGRRCYAAAWRGLEPPRHLVLFTISSLTLACALAGLCQPSVRRSQQAASIFTASGQIAASGGAGTFVKARRWLARGADVASLISPALGEEIIAVART